MSSSIEARGPIRDGVGVMGSEPAMSRFVKALVAEDECALAWVVDDGCDAVEAAHLAAAGVSDLELALAGMSSPSPTSPLPSSSSTSPRRPAC